MKKTVYTLIVDGFLPEVTNLTLPYMEKYASKIGADFHIISERKFPDMPVTYEKLQIYELGKDNDWNIFFDADALIHPDLFDITEQLKPDTVLHRGNDMAGNRWKYDKYFRRDGRNIGSGNWFTVASGLCLDLWHPLEDLTLEEALANIQPTSEEKNKGVTPSHLIDDYVLSRNIARYGLKFKTFDSLLADVGQAGFRYLHHEYLLGPGEKADAIRNIIKEWKL